ncbi:hypothetical protein BH11GEM2_BH11GEM2_30280 [soil metagenome]
MRQRLGVALLLVLWLIVVLGAIGGSLAASVHERVGVATNLRDDAVARAMAESGVVAASVEIGDSLGRLDAGPARAHYLNALTASAPAPYTLGDGTFQVSVVDVNARLDVNLASEDALSQFFSQFTNAVSAHEIAQEVRQRTGTSARQGAIATPFESIETLNESPSVDARLAAAVAPFITVDGDGNVNLTHAPLAVRRSAAGQVVDAPTRLMIVSRGARNGSSFVHEIEAVYAIQGSQLAFVRWRERVR